jgi:hypothetical protein
VLEYIKRLSVVLRALGLEKTRIAGVLVVDRMIGRAVARFGIRDICIDSLCYIIIQGWLEYIPLATVGVANT